VAWRTPALCPQQPRGLHVVIRDKNMPSALTQGVPLFLQFWRYQTDIKPSNIAHRPTGKPTDDSRKTKVVTPQLSDGARQSTVCQCGVPLSEDPPSNRGVGGLMGTGSGWLKGLPWHCGCPSQMLRQPKCPREKPSLGGEFAPSPHPAPHIAPLTFWMGSSTSKYPQGHTKFGLRRREGGGNWTQPVVPQGLGRKPQYPGGGWEPAPRVLVAEVSSTPPKPSPVCSLSPSPLPLTLR